MNYDYYNNTKLLFFFDNSIKIELVRNFVSLFYVNGRYVSRTVIRRIHLNEEFNILFNLKYNEILN